MAHDPKRLETFFVDVFLDSFTEAPEEIVLDFDATGDPVHGNQEGKSFHGYYRCYCYLPLYVTCGDHVLVVEPLVRRPRIHLGHPEYEHARAHLIAHRRVKLHARNALPQTGLEGPRDIEQARLDHFGPDPLVELDRRGDGRHAPVVTLPE